MKNKNEHIENEFPILDSLKTNNGFKTPEGYFDTLQNSIMSEVIVQPKEKKFSPFTVLKYAASVALIAGIASVFFFSSEGQTTEDDFGNLTVSEYMEGFSEIDLELDENLQFDEIAMN